MKVLTLVTTLAWRNLWRNHRRSIIMVSAVSVGVWAMIFMIALMRGMVNDMVRDGIRNLPGHVQVHHPDFRDDPSIVNVIPVDDAELERRFAGAVLDAWATRINVPAVVTSERDSRGVTLYGIDPARERELSFVADSIVAGRYLEDGADDGVVVGRKLTETLDTELGKRVVIMSQDPDNDIADRGFRIVGIFETGLESTEEAMVFAGKQTVQRMLRVGDRVTEIAVLGDDYRNVGPVRDKVEALVDESLEVSTWRELNTFLGTMLNVMDGFVIVWIVVIFLALSFGLVNTLVMAVFERVREIGLMLALGLRPASIMAQIVLESMLLLVIGLAVGTLLAWLTIVPMADGLDISVVAEGMEMFGAAPVLHPELTVADVALTFVVVLLLGLLASLSPAWRASRYEPMEAITKVAT